MSDAINEALNAQTDDKTGLPVIDQAGVPKRAKTAVISGFAMTIILLLIGTGIAAACYYLGDT